MESAVHDRAMTDDSTTDLKTERTGDGQEAVKPAEKPARKAAAKKARKTARKSAAKSAAAKTVARDIEARIGYSFTDGALLASALTHVSALKSPSDRTASYQRLEFLGDHVLGLAVSDMLFRAFPRGDEGELSKRLADLVRRETCADVARTLGLDEGIKLGAVGAPERLRKSVLGDICEAVIGAIFIDGGYQAAAEFVERAWSDRLRKPMRALRDPKTVLQEWAQGRGLPTPTYREVERTGPHHDPRFRIEVALPGLTPAEGVGSSKRAAEKAAALELLTREGVASGIDG
jgi:ribonuclease-3